MGGGAARGRERRKRTQQIALLINHVWQQPSLVRESALKACSPDPWYMAHTDYLQSNYSKYHFLAGQFTWGVWDFFWFFGFFCILSCFTKGPWDKVSHGKASVHCKDHLASAKSRDFPNASGGSMGSWHLFKMETADYFNSFSGLEKS